MLEFLSINISSLLTLVTVILIYRQIVIAVKSSRLDGFIKMQDMVDSFSKERNEIYQTFPIELALTESQLPVVPVSGSRINKNNMKLDYESLSENQKMILKDLTHEQIATARLVINKLNDLGLLLEHGFIDYRIFLGKYHSMIIRLVSILEPIRRDFEEKQGSNYGHRILRMRYNAIQYNRFTAKQNLKPIYIFQERKGKCKKICVVSSYDVNMREKIMFKLKKIFRKEYLLK